MATPSSDPTFSTPLTTLRAGVRQKQESPRARVAWRRLGQIAVGVVLLLLIGAWGAGFGQFLAAVAATAVVALIACLLTGEGRVSRIWRGALLLTGLLTWIPGATHVGQVFFVIVSVLFSIPPRYGVYAALGSRRRAMVFAGAMLLIIALIATSAPADREGWFSAVVVNVHQAGRIFLALFGAFTMATLFLHLRLNFLRLRPKLAVAGLLIAAVPMVLLSALAAVGVYGAVGGIRATQAQSVLRDWLTLANGRAEELRVFAPGFSDDAASQALRARIADAVATLDAQNPPDSFFLRDEAKVWAVRVEVIEGRVRLASAHRVTSATMARLADHIGCEVQLVGKPGAGRRRTTVVGIEAGSEPLGAGGEEPLRARPSFAPESDGESWYERWLLFGGSTVEMYVLDGTRLSRRQTLLSLQTRPIDVWNTFAGGDNEVNRAVLAALAALGIVFLILQGFALYFGLRITGGITLAVGKLHKATQRLAQGDLGARIELPNEDEFGDLAESFNEMTRAIGLAQEQLVHKHRLEQEIATARQIQQRLLPHAMPSLAGYEIAGSSTPSKMVGGDYFDFLELGNDRLGIAVADVSGKGIPAALLMSHLQASLQGQALIEGSVATMVTRMNEQLARSTDAHMFATFFYAVLDARTGHVCGVNAGHDPPMIVRVDGTVERLPSSGLILGMLPNQTYDECEVTLEPGDLLVLYTDGITEAMGPGTRIPGMDSGDGLEATLPALAVVDGGDDDDDDDDDEEVVTNFFEEHRLEQVIVARRQDGAEAIRRAVLLAVDRHTQDVPQSDDITLVVIKRTAALSGAAQ